MTTTATMKTTAAKTTFNKKEQVILQNLEANGNRDDWTPEVFLEQGKEFISDLKKGKVWLIVHRATTTNSIEVSIKVAEKHELIGMFALNYNALIKTILGGTRQRDGDHFFIGNTIDSELYRLLLTRLRQWGFITSQQEIKLRDKNLLIIAR